MTHSQTLLLIEDNDAQREALAQILTARGYHVREAADCEQGLGRLGAESAPDAILLDWVLPRMSGWEFLTQIRKNPDLAALPVVVISGYSERAQQASILSGATFLPKPVDQERLAAILEEQAVHPPPEILLVDDEPTVGEVLAFNLRHHGLAVRQVTGGQRAVELYRRHRARISLVLLDVLMPGMDGPRTCAELQKIDPGVKVVFMSGHAGEYTGDELMHTGALRVLQKPFSFMNKLADLLRQLATEARAPEARAPEARAPEARAIGEPRA